MSVSLQLDLPSILFYNLKLKSQQGNTKSIDEKLDNDLAEEVCVEVMPGLTVCTLTVLSYHLHTALCQQGTHFGLKQNKLANPLVTITCFF